MKILAIETSCDETAISIIEGTGPITEAKFNILTHLISSQAKLHAEWGGVVPMLAKREHAKNIIPLLDQALTESHLKQNKKSELDPKIKETIRTIFTHEEELIQKIINYLENTQPPPIDIIAVTSGPGLEPALWVGINIAKALSVAWQKPLMPINHMEGHIVACLLKPTKLIWPALALLVSGGHTELILIKNWFDYQIIGQTRDDAVGEAFDKVARLLDLPYPGGPEIAKLAKNGRPNTYILPRPMLKTADYDFSFSGLKTAVLYKIKDQKLSNQQKADLAREFQSAATEVLITKTFKAVTDFKIKTLIVGGGVIANQSLRDQLKKETANHNNLNLLLPEDLVTTDNATMIALATYLRLKNGLAGVDDLEKVTADGNAHL